MKFKVRRTSGKKPPCLNAIENEDGTWYIEIKNLKKLVEFANDHGEIVLYENTIEVYDDYRE